MTDDDVVPVNDWLDKLLDAQRRSNADVIVGPTSPDFPAGTPAWIEASGFFLKPQSQSSLKDLEPNPPAATCNVLFSASLLNEGKLAFDPALTLSGGEDKLLFQQLKRRGVKFAWAPEARAREHFPADRATPGYMLREAYRRGSVKCFIKQRLKSRSPWKSLLIALRLLVRSIFYLVRDLTLLLLNLPRGPDYRIQYGLRIANSIGTIAGVFRIPNQHYRRKGL